MTQFPIDPDLIEAWLERARRICEATGHGPWVPLWSDSTAERLTERQECARCGVARSLYPLEN